MEIVLLNLLKFFWHCFASIRTYPPTFFSEHTKFFGPFIKKLIVIYSIISLTLETSTEVLYVPSPTPLAKWSPSNVNIARAFPPHRVLIRIQLLIAKWKAVFHVNRHSSTNLVTRISSVDRWIMGLLRKFLSTSSIHGLAHTEQISAIRAKVWVIICVICYTAMLIFIGMVFSSATDSKNVVTKVDIDTVRDQGKPSQSKNK